MLDYKRDEDIIGILALGTRAGLLEDFPGFVANSASARIELLKIGGGCLRSGGLEQFAFLLKDAIELRLKFVQLRAVTALDGALITGLIEKDRWLFELIEKKDHRAEKQDQELQ